MAGTSQLLTGVRKRVSDKLRVCFPRHWQLPLDYASDLIGCAHEPELLNLDQLLKDCPRRRAIDVGANVGYYSYRLARSFERVEAFEPQAEVVARLGAWAASYQSNITIHPMGLSNATGHMTLHIPFSPHGTRTRPVASWATLNPIDVPHRDVEVPVGRLDDFGFDDVSFVKIDVEGHELDVLRGARQTLAQCRPVLLIEIEERHHPEATVASIIAEVCAMGYRPAVYRSGAIESILPGNGLPKPAPVNYLFFPQ